MRREEIESLQVGDNLIVNNVRYVIERAAGKIWVLSRLKDKAEVWLKKEWCGSRYVLHFSCSPRLTRRFDAQRYVKSFSMVGGDSCSRQSTLEKLREGCNWRVPNSGGTRNVDVRHATSEFLG